MHAWRVHTRCNKTLSKDGKFNERIGGQLIDQTQEVMLGAGLQRYSVLRWNKVCMHKPTIGVPSAKPRSICWSTIQQRGCLVACGSLKRKVDARPCTQCEAWACLRLRRLLAGKGQ